MLNNQPEVKLVNRASRDGFVQERIKLIKQINSASYNRGIYFNSANQMIYIAEYYYSIKVYDKDLNYIRTISTNYHPWFITGYNGQMVVTDYDGNINFYQGESLFRTVATHCDSLVTSF